jgi:hypothetical protein
MVHEFLQVLVLFNAESLLLDAQTHQDADQAFHQDLELLALFGCPFHILERLPVLAEQLPRVLVHFRLP